MSGAIHLCLSGNVACSGIMPCAECHGARSQVLARAFAMSGFTDRAQMQHFFAVYAGVWQEFQAQVLAAVPEVPPTLNGAMPASPAAEPASVPPPPPVGMSEVQAPGEVVGEVPAVAEEHDMMAPMTSDELTALLSRAQQPLPVEGPEAEPVAVAAPGEASPEPDKTPRQDREPKRGEYEAVKPETVTQQEKAGTP